MSQTSQLDIGIKHIYGIPMHSKPGTQRSKIYWVKCDLDLLLAEEESRPRSQPLSSRVEGELEYRVHFWLAKCFDVADRIDK
jgi:hypothetical protein